jgi:hypothetical protein
LKAKVCNLPLLSFPSTGTTVTRRLSSNNSWSKKLNFDMIMIYQFKKLVFINLQM